MFRKINTDVFPTSKQDSSSTKVTNTIQLTVCIGLKSSSLVVDEFKLANIDMNRSRQTELLPKPSVLFLVMTDIRTNPKDKIKMGVTKTPVLVQKVPSSTIVKEKIIAKRPTNGNKFNIGKLANKQQFCLIFVKIFCDLNFCIYKQSCHQ